MYMYNMHPPLLIKFWQKKVCAKHQTLWYVYQIWTYTDQNHLVCIAFLDFAIENWGGGVVGNVIGIA